MERDGGCFLRGLEREERSLSVVGFGEASPIPKMHPERTVADGRYVYLPVPPQLSADEILMRHRILKGDANRILSDDAFGIGAACRTPCANSAERAEARADLIRMIRRRMYSIAEYMRMIKQWFSTDYNGRNGHKGTMWEAIYCDNPMFLPEDVSDYADIRDILAYIHLNPIRAAITNRYDGYVWSSYTAFRRGDSDARAAMRRAYPDMTDEEIVEQHEMRMDLLLEDWKRRRADEIARKRLAGYEIPADSLTDECMIAQAQARIRQIQREVMDLQLKRRISGKESERREIACQQIVKMAAIRPDATPCTLAETLVLPLRTVQRYIGKLLAEGTLRRDHQGALVAA